MLHGCKGKFLYLGGMRGRRLECRYIPGAQNAGNSGETAEVPKEASQARPNVVREMHQPKTAPATGPPTYVAIRHEDSAVRLLVDEIGDVLEVEDENLDPPRETLDSEARGLIRGSYKLTDRLMQVLDTQKVVSLGGQAASRLKGWGCAFPMHGSVVASAGCGRYAATNSTDENWRSA